MISRNLVLTVFTSLFLSMVSLSQDIGKTTYTIVGKEVCNLLDNVEWECRKSTIDYSSIVITIIDLDGYDLGTVSYVDMKKRISEVLIDSIIDENELVTSDGNSRSSIVIDRVKKTITVATSYRKDIYIFK